MLLPTRTVFFGDKIYTYYNNVMVVEVDLEFYGLCVSVKIGDWINSGEYGLFYTHELHRDYLNTIRDTTIVVTNNFALHHETERESNEQS